MTRTDLANLALSHIGANLIPELDKEPLINPLLNQAIAQTLRGHDWNFAQHIVELAPIANPGPTPALHPHAFDLPSDYLRRTALTHEDSPLEALEFRILGPKLYSCFDALTLTYVRSAPPLADWPPDFTQAISTLLASKLAATRLKNPDLARELFQRYLTVELPEAKRNDTQDSPGSVFIHDRAAAATSPSLAARRGRHHRLVDPPA